MKIGLINGDCNLKFNLKDKNIHIKLITKDTDEKFDILIFNKPINFLAKKLFDTKNQKIFVLVNSDEYESFDAFKNIFLITYGINNKSCVTVSSIAQNRIQLCIQRNLFTLNNKIVEEQEFSINVKNGEKFLDELMFLATVNVLIFGDTNNLSKWF